MRTRLALAALLAPTALHAQPRTNSGVRGTAFDPRGEPALEVSVVVPDTAYRTRTDLDGRYELRLPPGRYTVRLVFDRTRHAERVDVEVRDGAFTDLDLRLGETPTPAAPPPTPPSPATEPVARQADPSPAPPTPTPAPTPTETPRDAGEAGGMDDPRRADRGTTATQLQVRRQSAAVSDGGVGARDRPRARRRGERRRAPRGGRHHRERALRVRARARRALRERAAQRHAPARPRPRRARRAARRAPRLAALGAQRLQVLHPRHARRLRGRVAAALVARLSHALHALGGALGGLRLAHPHGQRAGGQRQRHGPPGLRQRPPRAPPRGARAARGRGHRALPRRRHPHRPRDEQRLDRASPQRPAQPRVLALRGRHRAGPWATPGAALRAHLERRRDPQPRRPRTGAPGRHRRPTAAGVSRAADPGDPQHRRPLGRPRHGVALGHPPRRGELRRALGAVGDRRHHRAAGLQRDPRAELSPTHPALHPAVHGRRADQR